MDEKLQAILAKMGGDTPLAEANVKELGVMLQAKITEAQIDAEKKSIAVVGTKDQEIAELKAKIAKLEGEAQKESELPDESFMSVVESYLAQVAETYVEQNKVAFQDAADVAKAKGIMESFGKLAKQFSVDTSDVALDESVELTDMTEKYNLLAKSHMELKDNIQENTKIQMIESVSNSIEIESKKEEFKEIAMKFNFTEGIEFKETLDLFAKQYNAPITEGVNSEDTLDAEGKIVTESCDSGKPAEPVSAKYNGLDIYSYR